MRPDGHFAAVSKSDQSPFVFNIFDAAQMELGKAKTDLMIPKTSSTVSIQIRQT